MKHIFTITAAVLLITNLWAQSPEKMSYQAVIRNSSDDLISNTEVGMQISIISTTADGTAIYTETQRPTTNTNGLVSIEIGGDAATVILGDFSIIDWSSGTYFIKTETDPIGGTNYTITGTSQLLSVPYALHAKSAENITGEITYTETDPFYGSSVAAGISGSDTANWNNKLESEIDGSVTNEIQNLSNVLDQSTDAGNKNITNLANPQNEKDAVTKSYVDELKVQIEELQILAGVKVEDLDGNIYSTIEIGTQTWMTGNLITTKYNDGTPIPLVENDIAWGNLLTPGYCWYGNNEANYKNTYGALYNWYTINTNKLCPVGWHVPTDAEWTVLSTYLGGESIAGGKLKETSTTHWLSPNTGATNETGFTAIPSGRRGVDGTYFGINDFGSLWSALEYDVSNAWFRTLNHDSGNLVRSSYPKKIGYSVRCLKD